MLTETQIRADSSTAITNATESFKNDVLNNVINIDDYQYVCEDEQGRQYDNTLNFLNVFTQHHGCKWLLDDVDKGGDGGIIIEFPTENQKIAFILRWS